MPTECDRFELEICMRQHGALDAAEESALDAHLAGCAACAQFAAGGGRFEDAVQRQVRAETSRVDWSRLQERVTSWQRWHRRKLWLAPLFLLQIPLVFILGTGQLPPRELLIVGPPLTVAIYVAWVWLMNRPFREVLAVARAHDDLLAGWRRELVRKRRRARVFAWVNAALAFGCLAAAFAPGNPIRLMIFALGAAGLYGGWSAWDFAVTLPRLRDALDEANR
jgi:anti-sigma factor RsiW